jgi:signal transduction histidine kinase
MPDTLILIVDDDQTIVRLCQRLLERAGYRAISATDPLEAIQILAQREVDLLLTDIRMPVMDGFELISQAKQLLPDLPVLVMTGFASVDNAIQALHRGVDGLILKPFENTSDLAQSIQRVLEESRQRRDAARLQALRPLFDVSERLLAETSPQLLENLILDTIYEYFQTGFVGIYRQNAESDFLDIVRTSNSQPSTVDDVMQQQLLQGAMKSGSPSLLSVSGPDRSLMAGTMLKEIGWESLIVVPVTRNSTQFVLCASRPLGSAPFTQADLEMFVILCRQAAVALENARLYSDLRSYVMRIEESQRALVQAEKMAAVGRLVASLAHEINNPLQAVRNCLHLAGRKGIDNDQRMHYLEMTDAELERLVLTVRRMLDFYRPSGADKQRIDIRLLIDQVLALLGPQLREQAIQVHISYEGVNRPIAVVPDQIQQVIFNLIINAMDAMEEEERLGRLTSTAVEPRILAQAPKHVWIDVYHEEKLVRIQIEDSGPGISLEEQERVFEPFVSTKPHGTGLGLAVSYGIIEKHQGSLSIVDPKYGGGACFEISLPSGSEGEYGKNSHRG